MSASITPAEHARNWHQGSCSRSFVAVWRDCVVPSLVTVCKKPVNALEHLCRVAEFVGAISTEPRRRRVGARYLIAEDEESEYKY